MRRYPSRRRLPHLPTAALAFALLAPTRPSFAQAALPSLSVHRTEDTLDCPDADALAARVARHMGRPAVTPGASSGPPSTSSTPTFDVQIYRSEQGFTAVVQAGTSTRTLSDRGPRCAGLADALSITLAILLDELPPPPASPPASPPPSTPAPSAPPPEPPSREAPSAPPPAPAASTTPATIPPRSTGLAFGVSILPSIGTLAHPVSVGISGALTLSLGRFFAVEAGALAFPTQTIAFPYAVKRPLGDTTPTSAQSVALTVAAGLARGCAGAPVTARGTRVGACAGLLAGALLGQGRGFVVDKRSTDPWIAAEGSVLVEQPLVWRIVLVSRASLLVPIVRRTLEVSDVLDPSRSTAFAPSPVGGALDLGLRLSIW
jgi:hypothetical protein